MAQTASDRGLGVRPDPDNSEYGGSVARAPWRPVYLAISRSHAPLPALGAKAARP